MIRAIVQSDLLSRLLTFRENYQIEENKLLRQISSDRKAIIADKEKVIITRENTIPGR